MKYEYAIKCIEWFKEYYNGFLKKETLEEIESAIKLLQESEEK